MKIQHGQRRAVVCWGLLLVCWVGCAGPLRTQYDGMLAEINAKQGTCGVERGTWTLALAEGSWRTERLAYRYFVKARAARKRVEDKLGVCKVAFEIGLAEPLQKTCSMSENAVQNNPGVSNAVLLLDQLFADPQQAPNCEQAPTKKVKIQVVSTLPNGKAVRREGESLVFYVNAGDFLVQEDANATLGMTPSRLRSLWMESTVPWRPEAPAAAPACPVPSAGGATAP